MSGATPPNNRQASQVSDNQSSNTQTNQNALPIQGVSQATNQQPVTTAAAYTSQASSVSTQTPVMSSLLSQNNPAVINNCSEYCLEVLTHRNWRLNSQHYIYSKTDLF